jgi:hypothetical protein
METDASPQPVSGFGQAPALPVSGSSDPPALRRQLRALLETNPFPIFLVSLVGIVLLTVFAPSLVVGDTWLTLMAGREIVDHGLPHSEELTILGQGATWTDQQWLAQLVFYAAHELAGLRAVVVLDILLVLLALSLAAGAARSLGASSRSTFLIGLLAVLAGPWGWTIRAQSAALPLFAGTLWLLVDAYRNGMRRRTLLVLPLLVLWANLHGSVVLGAGLTALLAMAVLVRDRGANALLPATLLVIAPLCVLATPYGWDVVAYYDLMLVDAPFAEILREWQWSTPSGTTALFWALALLAVVLVALPRCRQKLSIFELLVLGVTFVGAVQAVRGVIWFALACAAILPAALDGLLTRADPSARRVNLGISSASLAGLAVALVVTLAQPQSWFSQEWPEERVEAVRTATRDPSTRLFATDGTADWLLWRIPELRGRIAYDVRFELYDERTLDAISRYGNTEGSDWISLADGYDVVIVDERAHLDAHLTQPGAKLAYRDDEIAIVARAGPP